MLTMERLRARWPTLARFCEDNGITPLVEPGDHGNWSFVHNVFGERRAGEAMRDHWEADLAFAYRTHALSKDRRRVISDPKASPYATLAELSVGRWLEEVHFKVEKWEPPAARGKTGDMLVRHEPSGLCVFVEVKTLFGDQAHREREKFGHLAAIHVEEELSRRGRLDLDHGESVLSLGSGKPDYDAGKVKAAVRDLLRRGATGQQDTTVKLGSLELQIEIGPKGNVAGGVGMFGDMPTPRELLRCMSDYQKPPEPMPEILVPYDFGQFVVHFDRARAPILDEVAEVFFGHPVEDGSVQPRIAYRERNGKWSRPNPSALNAVFAVAHRFGVAKSGAERRVRGYLKPGTDNPIRRDLFGSSVDEWFEDDPAIAITGKERQRENQP